MQQLDVCNAGIPTCNIQLIKEVDMKTCFLTPCSAISWCTSIPAAVPSKWRRKGRGEGGRGTGMVVE